MTYWRRWTAALLAVATSAMAGAALAQDGEPAEVAEGASNHAVDGGLGMLPAGSRLAEEVHFFHNGVLMPIITAISAFVLALLIYVIFRYNAKANPTPKRFSHNTLVEILWTGIPVLILLVIALFSFDLLYKEDVIPDGKQVAYVADGSSTTFAFPNDFASDRRRVTRRTHMRVLIGEGGELTELDRRAFDLEGLGEPSVTVTLNDAPAAGSEVVIRGGRSLVGRGDDFQKEIALAPSMTLKISGYQWGWNYAYPDFGDFEFASNMLPEDQTTPALYRLAVDNDVVIPVGETIRVTTTGRDVIHSWAMPNFALKIDAIPGRINEAWFKADKPGVYYGQCSEICGVKHAFMPIAVRAVSRPEFEAWVDGQRELAGMEPMFADDAEKFAARPATQLR